MLRFGKLRICICIIYAIQLFKNMRKRVIKIIYKQRVSTIFSIWIFKRGILCNLYLIFGIIYDMEKS